MHLSNILTPNDENKEMSLHKPQRRAPLYRGTFVPIWLAYLYL